MSQKILFLLFISLIGLPLKAQYESAFELKNNQYRLKVIDSLFIRFLHRKDTVGAINSLLNLKELSTKYKDETTSLEANILRLRLIPIKDSIDFEGRMELYEDYNQRAIDLDNPSLQIIALEHAAAQASFDKRSAKSLSYYLRANDLFGLLDKNHQPKAFIVQQSLARAFYNFGDYNRALEFAKNAITSSKDKHYMMLTHDLTSQIYLKLGDFINSKDQIEKGLSIYQKEDTNKALFKGWNGIFEGNYGKIHYYEKNYKEAILKIKNAINITKSANLLDNVSNFAILLAKSYINLNQIDEARKILPTIHEAIQISGTEENFVDYYKLLVILNTQLSPKEKYSLFDSISIWTNKMNAKFSHEVQLKTEMDNELIKSKNQQAELNNNIQKQINYRTWLLILLFLLSIGAWFIINKNQIQLKRQQRKTEEVSNEAKKMIEHAQLELFSFKQDLVKKNKLIEDLENQSSHHISENELDDLKQNSILTDNDWFRFKNLFNKVHPEFLQRLNKKLGELTPAEIRMLVLIKMGLNGKEMALTLGVSTGAIRTTKSRLLKKLHLDENESLEKLIEEI